jgi:predicted RNase H-like HicB family nuclease
MMAMNKDEHLEYAVILESGTNNWSAYVPDLPGCIATGKDREDTERRISDAIRFHIRCLREAGDPVPLPTSAATMVSVAA